MGHRRASNEVNEHEGALTRVISRSSLGAAALLLLLGACGGAAEGTPASAPPAATPGVGTVVPGATGAAGATTTTPAVNNTAGGTKTSGNTMIGAPGAMAPAGAPGAMMGQVAAPGAAQGTGILPCNVNKIMAKNCQNCHGAMPIGGAPMSLVTFADFQAPAKTQPTKKVHELVKERVHDKARPMPPIGELAAEDMAALDAWFTGGAVAGSAEDAACVVTPPTTGATGGNKDGSTGRLMPGPGETCYEFKVHGSQTSVDESKFMVQPGELYEQFYYKVPWPADQIATSYATIGDNAKVLHHWLLFSTNEAQTEGAHITAPLPTLIGTDPILLAGWAVGGPNLVMPSDVGMELPNPGRTMNVQWHFYNSGSAVEADASVVQICTVPKASRPNIGGITWMGTEDIGGNVWSGGPGMPPNQESTFTTNCRPGRSDIPIHIMGFEPHMHRIGKRMMTKVNHMGGMSEVIFDKPFNFGNETHYFEEYDLKAGETLTTSCTFMNDTDKGVPFGESTDTEMCYQFTFHYPAHALTNGAFSLLGVTDTCW